MYRRTFGTKNQVRFDTTADYYEFLGYLAKNDETTRLVWEHNDDQGAWAKEGRIQFYVHQPVSLNVRLKHTVGVGSIVSRVNCNEFIEHIAHYHHFVSNASQDQSRIRTSIPKAHINNFNRGLAL
jgi:hypothetical protein